MGNFKVIYDTAAEKILVNDYESVLNEVSATLSEAEYNHLNEVASIGYEYAAQKDEYVEALHETVSGWVAAARRTDFFLIDGSTEIDFGIWYNETIEVKKQMKANQNFNSIPTFFVYFGAVVLALFSVFATIFVMGICQKSFLINPVYLFMFTIGFLGLLLTDVAAIVEWRKGQNDWK